VIEFTAAFLAVASTDNDPDPVVRLIVFVVIFGLGFLILSRVFRRQSRKNVAAATGGAVDAFALPITPHPPFPQELAALRQLVGDSSHEPRINSYSRPVVTVDEVGLKISEKKLGTILTIPVADISSIEARSASIKPTIALVAAIVPSVWVGVKRDGVEASITLTPLVSSTFKATPAQAEAYAAELAAKLGALRD